jgi:methylenetetrahydrofolate reductase (NADPH)
MGRIIDMIHERRKHFQRHQRASESSSNVNDESSSLSLPPGWFYSFEFFPPKTEPGLDNLLTRIDRMAQRLDPLFISVTWSGPSAAARSLAVASHAQKYLGVHVMLHISMVGGTREQFAQVLEQTRASGIRNILALRGDPPRGQRESGGPNGATAAAAGGPPRAIDLVRLIRQLHGDYFGIAVAGHPEGHPASTSRHDEIIHLREKVQAGADFIVTQLFYDAQLFLDFCRTCRAAGIDCPILPGIMPIQSFTSFQRMTDYCQTAVPDHVWKRLEPVKGDDETVKQIGCEIAASMCRTILHATTLPGNDLGILDGVHFYTLNLERSVTNVLCIMGAVSFPQPDQQGPALSYAPPPPLPSQDDDKSTVAATARSSTNSEEFSQAVRPTAGRALPWRPSAMEKRSKNEQVRPINWANRPKSYVLRTEDWDEFPNGRWGDATSPAFGELSDLGHFYAFSLGSEDDQRAMLGESPATANDVYEVFARYVEGKIPYIPWCETPLQPESFLIQAQLSRLNRAGFLTINSQPAVNGVLSAHKTFGWGGSGGLIYQKAYCECFCSPENMRKLVDMTRNRPSVNLYAVNVSGDQVTQGTEPDGVTALTWGVFPNREILQPTIFDPSAFLVWAEEAFALWTTMWLNLYDFESGSYALIENMRDTFYLCAVVDNDFTSGHQRDDRQMGTHISIWEAMDRFAVR